MQDRQVHDLLYTDLQVVEKRTRDVGQVHDLHSTIIHISTGCKRLRELGMYRTIVDAGQVPDLQTFIGIRPEAAKVDDEKDNADNNNDGGN